MPKVTAPLSDAAIRRLNSKGRHPVGGVPGLRLQVSASGARSWILRATTVGGRVRDIGLGSYPTVSLKAARDQATTIRLDIQRKLDPLEQRRRNAHEIAATAAMRKTFDECAKDYIALQEKGWTNAKHAAQWITIFALRPVGLH